jgi:CO/xanthine dehydrogenase Mo-binding subunit
MSRRIGAPVGEGVPLLDARERVTGAVPFVGNQRVPGMLVGRVLRSPLAHARIRSLDASAARAIPGVVAVVTAADLGHETGPVLAYGRNVKDQEVVASRIVHYVGEPVALVSAETEAAAEAALAAIAVDYEELPAVYEALEAARPGAPRVHEGMDSNVFVHAKLRHGDVEAGFAAADAVVEETYTSPIAQQTSLEPHVAIAQWAGESLTVWTASQAPFAVRTALAGVFRVPEPSVRVIVPPIGGGYGGKGGMRVELPAAVLAWFSGGRPVRVLLSRAEEFVTVTKHAATITIRTGIKRDGTLTARQITCHWGTGAVVENSAALVRGALVRLVGPYRIGAVQVDSYGVYTNLPSAGAYRGAMSSQATWAYESHTDALARAIGMAPVELRRKSLIRSGETFATGETLHEVYFHECMEACLERLGWDEPLVQPSGQPGGALRRGRGVAVMMKSTNPVSRSECRLQLDADGVLTIYTGTVEMGQGTHTALAQVAAGELGLPLERVRVQGPDTALVPFDTATNASRSVGMMGTALLNAAAALRERLAGAAAPLLDLPPDQLTVADGAVASAGGRSLTYADVLAGAGVPSLDAAGEHATNVGLDPETGQGVGSPHWHQGAGACEVEVDTETGRVRVLRYVGASFAGRVINPDLARLQNDGNVIYGIGPALLEEMVFDAGRVVNPNLSDYQIPSLKDTPAWLEGVCIEHEEGEFHGIGEMTLPPVAPAIANAIEDAIGVRVRALPISAERVLRELDA